MLRDGPTRKAFDQSRSFTGEQPPRQDESHRLPHASTHGSFPRQPRVSALNAPTPRLILDPSSGISDQRIRHLEKQLPDWVSEITLSRRSLGPRKRRDRPPTRSARLLPAASYLIAAIRLNRRPPVGAVQELQLSLYSVLGEWPFRHVISAFPHEGRQTNSHKKQEAPLRKEVLRTLPVGNELVHLEEFILSSKGANVRFLVAKIFSPQVPALSEWKRRLAGPRATRAHRFKNATPSWVDATSKAAGANGFLRPEAVPRLVNRLLARSTLPTSVSDHRPRTPRTRTDLINRNWFRVDSKECLVAEDILDIRILPNGHAELFVGVVDIVSPGRPAIPTDAGDLSW